MFGPLAYKMSNLYVLSGKDQYCTMNQQLNFHANYTFDLLGILIGLSPVLLFLDIFGNIPVGSLRWSLCLWNTLKLDIITSCGSTAFFLLMQRMQPRSRIARRVVSRGPSKREPSPYYSRRVKSSLPTSATYIAN